MCTLNFGKELCIGLYDDYLASLNFYFSEYEATSIVAGAVAGAGAYSEIYLGRGNVP